MVAGRLNAKIRQFVIYDKPKDYPTKFVVRQWNIGSGTIEAGPVICTADRIEDARESLPPGVTLLPIDEDDPAIVEVWM